MEVTHCKQKQKQVLPLPPPPYRRRVTVFAGKSREEVKLAAIAISLNVRLRSAEMPFTMQERAVRHARSLLGSTTQRRPNPTPLALSLKKEFDSAYGPAWHCVVGKSFGSFVTYSPGGFVYFSIDDSLSFLLFKTEVHLVKEPSST
ncbi:dynein light chain, cytoplasmic-like [Olea europaea subsp. europaea]|uniref:Dynein light chain n=1 Tax=Olea europaea subsp. europaea TaxID=158383 RepID=A0A8S0S7C9_OLEEU|nr:dynein light chain, cytoplasmic-like [Olea europaea subsp. europaea]